MASSSWYPGHVTYELCILSLWPSSLRQRQSFHLSDTTPYCSFPRLLRVCLMLLSQGIDAAVNGYWESRNAGKLFKHMTIPEHE